MQWHKQAVNITTNLKVKIDFTLPGLSAKIIVTWGFHVDDSSRSRYDMMLRVYLLTAFGLNLKSYYHVIEADDGPFKGSTAPI